jgi:hypothetical protein
MYYLRYDFFILPGVRNLYISVSSAIIIVNQLHKTNIHCQEQSHINRYDQYHLASSSRTDVNKEEYLQTMQCVTVLLSFCFVVFEIFVSALMVASLGVTYKYKPYICCAPAVDFMFALLREHQNCKHITPYKLMIMYVIADNLSCKHK